MLSNSVLREDLEYIHSKLSVGERGKFHGSTVLVTGCGGFLGYYFMHYLAEYARQLGIEKIIGLDNFMLRTPEWLAYLEQSSPEVSIHKFDIITDDIAAIEAADKADFIIHMASIASPIFYRQFPIETLDANIWGLRRLLDFYQDKGIKGMLFFSSSEIYGDPDADNIPTSEAYRGNVACIGPRACYDEAKRFGETMCYLFSEKHDMPISVARPFNNYGPGMSLDDQRVPADFAKAVLEGRDIEMFSDGTPTRTFCYISDAICGYLKVLLYGKFDSFNIGIDKPEIQIKALADIYLKHANRLFGKRLSSRFAESRDSDYLTDNPNRRCPVIDKARNLLDYQPEISVDEGVERFLRYLHENGGRL